MVKTAVLASTIGSTQHLYILFHHSAGKIIIGRRSRDYGGKACFIRDWQSLGLKLERSIFYPCLGFCVFEIPDHGRQTLDGWRLAVSPCIWTR